MLAVSESLHTDPSLILSVWLLYILLWSRASYHALISQRGNCNPTSDILKCMCTHIKMGVLFRGYGVQHSNSNTVQGDFNVSLSSCRSVYFIQYSRLVVVHNLKCFGL